MLTEMKDCAKRIAQRILELALQTVKSAVNQILALVPDLFFACLEAKGLSDWIIFIISNLLIGFSGKKFE